MVEVGSEILSEEEEEEEEEELNQTAT